MIALVIAAVFLVLGLIILQGIRDSDIVSDANSVTASNETLTTVAETGEDFATVNFCGVTCGSVLATNATSGDVIPSTNYTQANCNVAFSAEASDVLGVNNSDWNVSYAYTYGDEACEAGNESIVGLGTFADFWEIIVLAIVITVVIGLLLVVFGGRTRR